MSLTLGVAGDRKYADYAMFSKVMSDELERYPNMIGRIITGDSSGADTMALDWAQEHGIPVTVYCASAPNYRRLVAADVDAVLVSDWRVLGNIAGPYRNARLVADADMILVFDGGGPGTRSVRQLAKREGKPVERWEIAGTANAAQQ